MPRLTTRYGVLAIGPPLQSLYEFSPLALGSYWALIPVALFLVLLVVRILLIEAVPAKAVHFMQEFYPTVGR